MSMQSLMLLLCIGQFLIDVESRFPFYYEYSDSEFCKSNPCQNGAVCLRNDCRCINPYSSENYYHGEFCEKVTKNLCYPNPCMNDGWCVLAFDAKSFGCLCSEGNFFYGDRCQNDFRKSTFRLMRPFWWSEDYNDDCGYLQLKVNGKWGAVCEDSLKGNAKTTVADVTCKGFGKDRGSQYCEPQKKGGPVVVQSINCNGNETSVSECEMKMGTDCKGSGLWIKCDPQWVG